MSVLRQDHYAFDELRPCRTPLSSATSACTTSCRRRTRSTPRRISQRRTATRASELEAEFAELNGWEAESNAASLSSGSGHLPEEILDQKLMIRTDR